MCIGKIIVVAITGLYLSISLTAHAQIVADGGFELGAPNPVWDEFSTNFDSPICSVDQCTGFFGGAFEGDWWAWFGGANMLEIGYLRQEVTIPSGTATLTFWLDITANSGNGGDCMTVSLDRVVLFTVFESEVGEYHPWTEVTIDISAFADGQSHLLSFDSTVTGPMLSNFFVDAVGITVQNACPWDLDGTGSVGVSDLLELLASWGPCKGCPADFDGNDDVGVSDLLALLANWGPCL